jgi:hypothetical protein
MKTSAPTMRIPAATSVIVVERRRFSSESARLESIVTGRP